MNAPNQTIADYYSLGPANIFVLRSLSMTQGLTRSGICKQSLSVVMTTATQDGGPTFHLSFREVRKLTFQQPDWSEISIGHLAIRSSAETTNASGRHLVSDADQERIKSFECNDFDSDVG